MPQLLSLFTLAKITGQNVHCPTILDGNVTEQIGSYYTEVYLYRLTTCAVAYVIHYKTIVPEKNPISDDLVKHAG